MDVFFSFFNFFMWKYEIHQQSYPTRYESIKSEMFFDLADIFRKYINVHI